MHSNVPIRQKSAADAARVRSLVNTRKAKQSPSKIPRPSPDSRKRSRAEASEETVACKAKTVDNWKTRIEELDEQNKALRKENAQLYGQIEELRNDHERELKLQDGRARQARYEAKARSQATQELIADLEEQLKKALDMRGRPRKQEMTGKSLEQRRDAAQSHSTKTNTTGKWKGAL